MDKRQFRLHPAIRIFSFGAVWRPYPTLGRSGFGSKLSEKTEGKGDRQRWQVLTCATKQLYWIELHWLRRFTSSNLFQPVSPFNFISSWRRDFFSPAARWDAPKRGAWTLPPWPRPALNHAAPATRSGHGSGWLAWFGMINAVDMLRHASTCLIDNSSAFNCYMNKESSRQLATPRNITRKSGVKPLAGSTPDPRPPFGPPDILRCWVHPSPKRLQHCTVDRLCMAQNISKLAPKAMNMSFKGGAALMNWSKPPLPHVLAIAKPVRSKPLICLEDQRWGQNAQRKTQQLLPKPMHLRFQFCQNIERDQCQPILKNEVIQHEVFHQFQLIQAASSLEK